MKSISFITSLFKKRSDCALPCGQLGMIAMQCKGSNRFDTQIMFLGLFPIKQSRFTLSAFVEAPITRQETLEFKKLNQNKFRFDGNIFCLLV